MKLEFSRQIFENLQISNFMKICPVGAELFHAGGRSDGGTDMTKLLAILKNAPKHIGFNGINLDSRFLCRAKYASVAMKGVGQVYGR
jgi:hypothetical protein